MRLENEKESFGDVHHRLLVLVLLGMVINSPILAPFVAISYVKKWLNDRKKLDYAVSSTPCSV